MVVLGRLLIDRDLARPGRTLPGHDLSGEERTVRPGPADNHHHPADRAAARGSQLPPGVVDEPLQVCYLRQGPYPGRHRR